VAVRFVTDVVLGAAVSVLVSVTVSVLAGSVIVRVSVAVVAAVVVVSVVVVSAVATLPTPAASPAPMASGASSRINGTLPREVMEKLSPVACRDATVRPRLSMACPHHRHHAVAHPLDHLSPHWSDGCAWEMMGAPWATFSCSRCLQP
jgi:hypothetical protein